MSRNAWRELVARFAMECRSAGLDLVHAFALADYNRNVAAGDRLLDFGRSRALAILVGNTRALWPVFARAREADPALSRTDHPLDTYVASSVERAIAAATPLLHQSHFSHVTVPRALPIQRAAELSGFAAISPSHLAIHPIHGPWFALRAVVVVDCEGPSDSAPAPPRPCQDCPQPCVAALARAVAASGPELDSQAVRANAADWIAVRAVCPIGQGSRYGEEQLRYHYGVDRQAPRHGS